MPQEQIVAHYTRYDERERLGHDAGPLELAHTRGLVRGYVPCPPAVTLDLGGSGAGRPPR